MKRKALLGTMLLSAIAWESYATNPQQQQQQMNRPQFSGVGATASLARLKEICHDTENNPQMLPFLSQFDCHETRSFWAKVGTQKFPLLNEAGISIKALIKDGTRQSDWMDLPGASEDQWGTCDVLEKVHATARYAVTIDSCAQLDAITTEQEFCADQLADVWNGCNAEQNDAMAPSLAAGTFLVPQNGNCAYDKTGIVKKCVDSEVIPVTPRCQQQQQQQQAQCSASSTPQQCMQQQQQFQAQCDSGEPIVSDNEMGADIRDIVVHKSGVHPRHKAVVIVSEPIKGGIISNLGLAKDDVVSNIKLGTWHRIRSEADFFKFVAKAKADGKVRIEYRDATDGKWKTKDVSSF